MELIKFPEIESFATIRNNILKSLDNNINVYHRISYVSKVKLHGSNGGICIGRADNGEIEVIPQGRNRFLTESDDNYGFAKWVLKNKNYWKIFYEVNQQELGSQCIVFGEWCGLGIQNKVAISKIDRKVFCVFSVCYKSDTGFVMNNDPKSLQLMFDNSGKVDDVFIIPFIEKQFHVVDFTKEDSCKLFVEECNKNVMKIENCDEFVKNTFGVEGIGEGVVYYPFVGWNMRTGQMTDMLSDNLTHIHREDYSRYIFKAKGKEHQVIKQKKAVIVDNIKIDNINTFVDTVLTEERMRQAVSEEIESKGVAKTTKETFKIIAWVGKDIKKDIDNNEILLPENIEWKEVSNIINKKVSKWYINECNKI